MEYIIPFPVTTSDGLILNTSDATDSSEQMTTKTSTFMDLTWYQDYSERSHVLTGTVLKDKLANFRQEILSPNKECHYHPRLKVGKGWLIDKAFAPVVLAALQQWQLEPRMMITPDNQRATPPGTSSTTAKHPPYRMMLCQAMRDLNTYHTHTTSRQALEKYLLINYNVPEKSCRHTMNLALRKGVAQGIFHQDKQSFKLTPSGKPKNVSSS